MNRNLFPRAAALLLAVVAPAPAAATTAETSPGPIFSSLDTDRNGQLSPAEFRAGYPRLQQAIAVELRLREQFRAVDADDSGTLAAGEYARMALVRRAASAPPMATWDADRDGALSFPEYVAAVAALAARGAPAAREAPAARDVPAAGGASPARTSPGARR